MGGKAFDNVQPVPLEAVIKLSNWVAQLFEHRQNREFSLGFTSSMKGVATDSDNNLHELFVKNGLRWLGSTGKKPISGDVDIAVTNKEWTYDTLYSFLTASLPKKDVKGNGSLNQIYTRLECDGVYYQVDFMVGDVDLLEFTHWSPFPGSSSYSGSHRTELIKIVAKVLSDWVLVMPVSHLYNPGEMVARLGYTLNHDKGLVYGGRFAPKRKDGKGYTKKMVPVTEANLQEFLDDFFPSWMVSGWESIINSEEDLITRTYTDPVVIVEELFGEDVEVESLNSYENVVDVILASPRLRKHRDLIWHLYVERLNQISQPIPSPTINELFTIRGLD